MLQSESNLGVAERYRRIDAPETRTGQILAEVRARLNDSPHFRSHSREVSLRFADGVLTLHGCVPSFYLKQVLQSLLADVEGVEWIDNQVDVRSSCGLSSVRPR
jgi:osmotically-inducible protein OsmY